jgi:hypothetical protein
MTVILYITGLADVFPVYLGNYARNIRTETRREPPLQPEQKKNAFD